MSQTSTSRPLNALERLQRAVAMAEADVPFVRIGGTVKQLTPASYRVEGLEKFVRLGEHVQIAGIKPAQRGEVIRIDTDGVTIKPFEGITRAGIGARIWLRGHLKLLPHPEWKGRVLDALGEPLDALGALPLGTDSLATDGEPPNPLNRRRITTPLKTGVRVIDLFTPLCAGQRIGIFAGSGVGKSTLLAMLARALIFDTVVIALVGERGREVREFLEDLSAETRRRTVAVVSTGDQSPMKRRLAPNAALTIAEYFRDRGDNVLLIVDSVTRYAHAARDVALAAGEPPVARGYTPSVFSDLPRLLERAGPGAEGQGSITGVFSVLVDGDDHNDPIADSIRGTLDGHIVLDRGIAEQGRYPAVNPLSSISRLAGLAWSPEQRDLVLKLRSMIALYEETRDLRLMGGYRHGTDPELDKAVGVVPRLLDALKQTPDQSASTDAFLEVARALRE